MVNGDDIPLCLVSGDNISLYLVNGDDIPLCLVSGDVYLVSGDVIRLRLVRREHVPLLSSFMTKTKQKEI